MALKSSPKNLPTRLLDKVRRGVENVAYGNALYQRFLNGGEGVPDRLHFTLPDPWPGDAAAGQALMSTQGALFGRPLPPRQAVALRNLRAVGTQAARQMALALIGQWLERYDQWHDYEWSPDIMGERIGAWVGFYEFYATAADPATIAAMTASLQRQYRHLVRTLSQGISGVPGLRAIKGLALGALNFDEDDKALGLACDLLGRQLTAEILADGGVVNRSPSTLLGMVRHLVDLRQIFATAGIESPPILTASINAMVPALKLFRHGDGSLALFHGGVEELPLLIDAVITHSEAKGRVARRLQKTGYERLTAGRSLLIADSSAPPPRGHDQTGHAGLLSFEFGQGRERLIVNCGAVDGATGDWRMACAATAAHSTITVEDTNACEVLETGGVVSAARVTAQRFEHQGAHCLEMTHDGYRLMFGIICQRRLSLSEDGEELRGNDQLQGPAGRSFTLRWHLHPSVQVSLAQSGQAALLRTHSGNGWRLRTEGHALTLEPGIYCGSGAPRRSLQLKLSGVTGTPLTEVSWVLARERKS